MAKKAILFLHGFASSARSTKAEFLKKKLEADPDVEFLAIEFTPTPTDFEYMTTTGLIDRLRQYVLDHQLEELCIVGSSYGGLVAVHYAHRYGGVEHMLLLAPGLVWLSGGLSQEQLEQWKQAKVAPVHHDGFQRELPLRYALQVDGLSYLEFVPPVAPMVIVHGTRDAAVPLDHSRAYAAQFPEQVRLIEVDTDHDLNGHLDLIWDLVCTFLLE